MGENIVTPGMEQGRQWKKKDGSPKGLYVVTKMYGETLTELSPWLDEKAKKYDQYKLSLPESVVELCGEIRKVGGRAMVVGGAVRDLVVGVEHPELISEPKDIDLEIYGLDIQTVQKILEINLGEVNLEGKAFQVMKVRVEGLVEAMDASLPRKDSKTGSSHKDFETTAFPSMTLDEAALRRDLSINTLTYDPLEGIVFDTQNGVEDIKNKKIRVTDREAFREDPLRVYRVMQFASRLGFGIDDDTVSLCKEMVESGELDNLSEDRVTSEFIKLLAKGKKPSIGLKFAGEIGIVEKYWEEIFKMVGVRQDAKHHPEGDVFSHTCQVVDAAAEIARRDKLSGRETLLLTLGALCHDLGKAISTQISVEEDGKEKITAYGHEVAGVDVVDEFLSRFRLPKDVVETVKLLVRYHMVPPQLYDESQKTDGNMHKAIQRVLGKYGDFEMMARIAEADMRGRNGDDQTPLSEEFASLEWMSWFKTQSENVINKEKNAQGLLSGKDVVSLFESNVGGPYVGYILEIMSEAFLEGLISSREEAIGLVVVCREFLAFEGKQLRVTSRDEISKFLDSKLVFEKWREQYQN